MEAIRELPGGVRQLPKKAELALELPAEGMIILGRTGRRLTVRAEERRLSARSECIPGIPSVSWYEVEWYRVRTPCVSIAE